MPEAIGPYTPLKQIGEGGMGVVYEARQERPVRRTVALKVIKAGMDTKQLIARFEAERQALALMDHPGIAKIYDAGETSAGRPYFAMELVEGVPITRYCDEHGLDLRERLQLFAEVCRAVQHAHQKGVIHRDLKPSNILVGSPDGRPAPKIIDFGIAKAIAGQKTLTDKTLLTSYQQVLGTPAYMSPEQLDISGIDVDTRTDIYALGVVLYELVTDRLPFDAERLRRASSAELERILVEEDPPKPSKHVRTLARDVDWIVMKALNKNRNQRYDSVGAFREDVMAFLRHQTVSARPPAAGYVVGKFVRRHRWGIGFAASVVLLLMAGIVVSTWLAIRATRAERAEAQKSRLAQQRLEASDAMLDFITMDMLGQARPSEQADRDIKLSTVLDAAAEEVDEKFAGQPRVRCFMNLRLASIYENLGNFDRADIHAERARNALNTLEARTDPKEKALWQELRELSADISYQFASHAMGRADYTAAIPYLEEALEKNRICRGPNAALTIEIREQIGYCYQGLGRLEEAAVVLTKCLEDFKRYQPDEGAIRWITPASILADLHRKLGNDREADAYLREAEEMLGRSDLPKHHPLRIATLNNLGTAYLQKGEPEKAAPFLEESLSSGLAAYGRGHVRTFGASHNLAVAYTQLERHDEAFRHYQSAWEGQRDLAGPGNEWTLIYLRDLTRGAGFAGRRADEERYLDRLIDEAHAHFGDSHYLTSWAIDRYRALWGDDPEKMDALVVRLTGAVPWDRERVRVLVQTGSHWRYHTGAPPPADWTTLSFDDAAWPEGPAPLGYGESEIATGIPYGEDAKMKWAGSFFRQRFAVALDEKIAQARIRVRRDDGVAVFLNGKEVVRQYLPNSEATTWQTFASSEVGGLEEQLYYAVEIDPSALGEENCLAVQVHQCNGASSDVFFDLILEAMVE